MSLTLRVRFYQQEPPDRTLNTTFGVAGGTIGRHAANDWVLPDPHSFISGQHAKISFRDGDWYLTDTSTNGVFINSQEQPVGNGNSVALHSGDRILMGEYEMVAEVAPASPDVLPPDISSAETTSPDWDDSLFEINGGAPEVPGVPGACLQTLDDEAARDLFADTAEVGSMLDEHMPGIHSIPDNWAEVAEVETDAERGGEIPSSSADQAVREELESEPGIEGNASPAPAPAPDASEAGPDRPAQVPIPGGRNRVARGRLRTLPRKIEAEPVRPAEAPERLAHGVDESARKALMRGLGLPESSLADIPLNELLETLGMVLHQAIGGTLAILGSRADIKSEFRMSQTVIRPVENNPLKFAANAQDALRKLLARRPEAGYLEPEQAVREAFDDIKAHQLAVLSGMQAALQALISRFDPDVLIERVHRDSVLNKVGVVRRARTWELFVQQYADIAQEAEDEFQLLFGSAFCQAYERQIQQYKQSQSDAGNP